MFLVASRLTASVSCDPDADFARLFRPPIPPKKNQGTIHMAMIC